MATDYTDSGIDPESGLALRERLACDHYLTHLNQTKAYRDAGYAADSYDNARKDANNLFNRPHVRSWLDQKMAERRERLEVSAARILLELAVCAYASQGDYRINENTGRVEVMPGVPAELLRAVQTVEVTRTTTTTRTRTGGTTTENTDVRYTGKVRLYDKLKAAELLCRHLGLVSADLPPLEVLLNRLPPPVASILRQLLARPAGDRQPITQGK